MQNKLHTFKLLIKNQIIIFKNKKSNIVLFSLYIFLSIAFNIATILMINSKTNVVSNFTYINLFIIVNSIILLIVLSLLVSNILFGQFANNVHKLELRQGIGKNLVFFTRVIFILLTTFIFLLSSMIISLIFAGIGWGIVGKDILIYRAFISAWGWYFMFAFIVVSLSIFIVAIGKNAVLINTLVILFNVLILLFVSLFSVIGIINNNPNNPNFNNIRYTNNILFKVDNSLRLNERINKSVNLKALSDEAFKTEPGSEDYFIAGYKAWWKQESKFLDELSKK